MSIEVTYDETEATFAVRPEFGRPVTFVVRQTHGWIVGLKGGSRRGFSSHRTYDTACRKALTRARRYDKAYSVPRGVRVEVAA